MFKKGKREKHLVGQTEAARGFRDRWLNHRIVLRNNKMINEFIQNYYNKYSESKFVFVVLEECLSEKLNEREIYWSRKLNSMCYQNGFNLREPGGSKAGFSEFVRKKIGEAGKGRKPT